MIGVRICGKFADDLAMSAMNAIEDTDGEPGIFGGYFFKRMIMLHGMKKNRRPFITQGERHFIYVLSGSICKENFLWLPFARTVFIDDEFHESNQFALRTDAAYFGFRGFTGYFDTVPMTVNASCNFRRGTESRNENLPLLVRRNPTRYAPQPSITPRSFASERT
jgi:hypothetical protein